MKLYTFEELIEQGKPRSRTLWNEHVKKGEARPTLSNVKRCLPYMPPGAKLMFVGQAPSDDELREQKPLVGTAGREFTRLCKLAGIDREQCAITNVFDFKLEKHEVERLCLTTKELKERKKLAREQAKEGQEKLLTYELYHDYDLPPIKRGFYLRADFVECLERLGMEIAHVKPNLIVPLGDEALWALTGQSGISAVRGNVGLSSAPWLWAQYKILPTFHPSFVMRQYRSRFTVIADLIRAQREAGFPEIRRITRELWLDPTLDDIRTFKHEFLDPAEAIAVDIETTLKGGGQITEISFAPTPRLSLCVPFTDKGLNYHYWKSAEEEAEAWRLVRDICQSPVPKVLQNGLYDAYWLWMKCKIKTRNYLHDTRLLHHALFPEMEKSLGYMGSVWEDESSWKQMRGGSKADKRDD